MSVSRRELAAMQSAGWEVQTYTLWDRLRAVLGRRRPVARQWSAQQRSVERVPAGRWSA